MTVVTLRRVGECRRCGWCCRGCVHLKPAWEGVKPGLYSCEIHEHLEEGCEVCHQTHGGCLSYPDRPNRLENPYCGYRFLEQPSQAEVIRLEYAEWDWLTLHGSK